MNLVKVNEAHGHYTTVHSAHCHTVKRPGSKAKPWDTGTLNQESVFRVVRREDLRVCRICNPFRNSE